MGLFTMEQAITNLVQRLEAVTNRLEKVENQLQSGGGAAAGGAPAAAGSGASGAAWVGEFDSFFNENVPKLVELSQKVGNAELKAQVAAFEAALKAHREFLNVASKCDKPDDATLGKLLEPTSQRVGEVISLRDSNRGNEQWNHLSALSEVAPALGWVTVSPTPGPFVAEFKGNSEFYTNKMLREYKGKDEDQVAWINALKGFFTSLVASSSNTTPPVLSGRRVARMLPLMLALLPLLLLLPLPLLVEPLLPRLPLPFPPLPRLELT